MSTETQWGDFLDAYGVAVEGAKGAASLFKEVFDLFASNANRSALLHPFEAQLSWAPVDGATSYLVQRADGETSPPTDHVFPTSPTEHTVVTDWTPTAEQMPPNWWHGGGGYVHLTYFVYSVGPDGRLSAPAEVPIRVTRSTDDPNLAPAIRSVVERAATTCGHAGNSPVFALAPQVLPQPPSPDDTVLRYSLMCDVDTDVRPPISNTNATFIWKDHAGSVTTGWEFHPVQQGVKTTLEVRSPDDVEFLSGGGCYREMTHWSTPSGTASGDHAFLNMSNLVGVPKNVPRLTSMDSIFRGTSSLNDPNVSDWDTSLVTNMSGAFLHTDVFNQPLRWDISHVEDMSSMFRGAISFNQALRGWDTSSVTDMSNMFLDAKKFNQNLQNWDVTEVANHSNFNLRSALTPDNFPLFH